MKLPAFHFLVWLLLFQHLSTCHGSDLYERMETDHYGSGHGRSFFYYNQSDRVQVLSEIKQAIRARYALLDIKRYRLGVDATQVFEHAIERERQIEDVNDVVAQARANLEFLDRLKSTAAKLQDTHLQIKELMALPEVYLGIKTRLIAGRLHVAAIDNQLEEQWRHRQLSIEVGDEIVSIDGEPVHLYLQRLQSFIAGSSVDYRRLLAAESFAKRAFYYPQQATAKLTIRSLEDQITRDFELKWYTNAQIIRSDVAHYFKELGISFRPEESYVGFNIFDAPAELETIEEWYAVDAPDQLIYRLGYLRLSDLKKVAVLQVYSFYSLEVIQAEGDMIQPWESPVLRFIKNLKLRKLPLILDLRWNEGGHTFLAEALMRALMPEDVSYPSYTEAFRITPSIRQMWQGQNYPIELTHSDSQAVRYVNEAAMQGHDHTKVWAHSSPLTAHPEVGGYNQQLITMISPFCLSSCELLTMLLQSNKRALLLGSSTNGTGAGYFEWEPYSGGRWSDSYEIVSADIPNYLIGRPAESGTLLYSEATAFLDFNKENQPIYAEEHYEEGVLDLLQSSSAWYQKAISFLSPRYFDQSH